MTRFAGVLLLFFAASTGPVLSGDSDLKSEEVHQAWLQMYDLKFEEAHQLLTRWRESHPNDCLGPASDAACSLFSELARLGVLESELFVSDTQFKNRKKLDPNAEVKASFTKQINQADELADLALQKSSTDARALFVKTLTHGLRADYVALVDGQGFKALSYTKSGRVYAEKLLVIDPEAFDAYLGLGLENYLLSLKPIALRILLRLTGSQIDQEKGLKQLRKVARKGYYLEPFAKLLLAVAALRDNNPQRARRTLTELYQRFPDNGLYSLELNRLDAATP